MNRWEQRDAQRRKARYGMAVTGRSVKLLDEIVQRRAAEAEQAAAARRQAAQRAVDSNREALRKLAE